MKKYDIVFELLDFGDVNDKFGMFHIFRNGGWFY